MLLLTSFALIQQTATKSDSKLVTDSCPSAVTRARTSISSLDSPDFKQFYVDKAVTTDDPDGCCIQWVPGQAKGCSQTKQKQCKDDAEAVNAKWSWHAGACKDEDGCH
jgi:hypothetical protein